MKKQKFILVFLLPLVCCNVFSQELTKREQRKLQAQSEHFLLLGDPLNSWLLSRKLLLANPTHRDAGTSACVAALQLNYPADSILFTEKSLRASKDRCRFF